MVHLDKLIEDGDAMSFILNDEHGIEYTKLHCICRKYANQIPLAVQCRTCNPLNWPLPPTFSEANQKRIWKASRVAQSQYLDSIASLNVYHPPTLQIGVNWNQMSDRPVPGIVKRNVPSHGCSTKSSITRERPGAQSAPGSGVDVKHGSYHRYLERLKGKGPARTQLPNHNIPLYGNKTRAYGVSNSNSCFCR